MADHCPGCNLVFERESDFWLGAYVINLAVTEGLLVLALLVYVVRAVSDGTTATLPVIVTTVIFAVAAPILFFPFSRTIWAAIDLAMRPVPLADPEIMGGSRGDDGRQPVHDSQGH